MPIMVMRENIALATTNNINTLVVLRGPCVSVRGLKMMASRWARLSKFYEFVGEMRM